MALLVQYVRCYEYKPRETWVREGIRSRTTAQRTAPANNLQRHPTPLNGRQKHVTRSVNKRIRHSSIAGSDIHQT